MTQPKWSRKHAIWLRIYVEHPVFGDSVLSALKEVIHRLLPQWTSTLQAAKSPDSRTVVHVPPDSRLSDLLGQAAPTKQGLGSGVLKGAYKGITIYLDSCDETLPPELNCIAVEVRGVTDVEGRHPADWAAAFFGELVAAIPARYGNVRLSEEFDAKNLVLDAEGTRAAGVRLDVSLPGLFWLNYFGRPYLALFGEDRMLSAPAYSVRRVSNGVLIALDETPLNWQATEYQRKERAVIEHLGPEHFFLKSEHGRTLVAADFRAGPGAQG